MEGREEPDGEPAPQDVDTQPQSSPPKQQDTQRGIFYVSVSRGGIELASHAAVGVEEFRATIAKALRRIPQEDCRRRYLYKGTTQYNFLVSRGVTFLCLSLESFGGTVPFAFLKDVRSKLFVHYEPEQLAAAGEGSLQKQFGSLLVRHMEFYNANVATFDRKRAAGAALPSQAASNGGFSGQGSDQGSVSPTRPGFFQAGHSRVPQSVALSASPSASTVSEAAMEGVVEHVYKIIVVGDGGTGKTSVIRRYVHNRWSINYIATVGVAFELKQLNWDPATVVKLQLWDISGQDRFRTMTRVYYKQAVAAVVVFDVTRVDTLISVGEWKGDIDDKVTLHDGRQIPSVLLANKIDLVESAGVAAVPNEDIDRVSEQHGFLSWFPTSAKDNTGIEDAMQFLVSRLLQSKEPHTSSTAPFDRPIPPEEGVGDRKSCCS